MGIKVIFPGALTTIQDQGRYGYEQYGMAVSGAMDLKSFRTANRLCGNPDSAAALECTLLGGIYQFTEDAVIAVTGADMQPALNQSPVSSYKPVSVHAGEILNLGSVQSGCRTYLAVRGGIDVPLVMNSRSTNIRCRIGGFQGRALAAGDLLPIGTLPEETTDKSAPSNRPDHLSQPDFLSSIRVRVIEGPQDNYFPAETFETLYSQAYQVDTASDRMGIRLDGPVLKSLHGTDILSDGTCFGSIQVTSSGMPIILMADRQTTGGYAKIATVVSSDLPLLAQAKPGDQVRFIKAADMT